MAKSATAINTIKRPATRAQLPPQGLTGGAISLVGPGITGGMQLGKGAQQSYVGTPIKRKISLRTPAGKRNNVTVTFTHKTDPRQALLERIGPMPDGIVQFSRILVAVYVPPVVEKTDGGVILTPVMQQEDLEEFFWQGKVGLIVAMGPQAYVDDEATKFHGTRNEVGDWVWFRPSDGMACEVNGVFCRMVSESGILGKIPHPDCVW